VNARPRGLQLSLRQQGVRDATMATNTRDLTPAECNGEGSFLGLDGTCADIHTIAPHLCQGVVNLL
jgi:hypothetical protein